MTIVEALKKFYEGNAYNEQDLKEADSVLDAIRAKYGPYEGANIAEYLQTAMSNGATPGSGGGGDYPTFTLTYEGMEFVSGTCDMTFAECKALCTEEYAYTCPCICLYYDNGEETHTIKIYNLMQYSSDDEGIIFGSFTYSADGTITFGDR